jgi:hypothetical protein
MGVIVKYTSISVDEGEETLRQLRHGLCMCAIQRVNIFKCLSTGYGSRCHGRQFLLRTDTLLGFFYAQKFPVCIKTKDNLTQLWEALESTWASIPVKVLYTRYINSICTVFLPYPVELEHPARQGEVYVMPLSEHTGSHSPAKQEQSLLHSDHRLPLYTTPGVLGDRENGCQS